MVEGGRCWDRFSPLGLRTGCLCFMVESFGLNLVWPDLDFLSLGTDEEMQWENITVDCSIFYSRKPRKNDESHSERILGEIIERSQRDSLNKYPEEFLKKILNESMKKFRGIF